MADIESKVKQIVTEQLNVEEGDMKLDAKLVDDLGADSLDFTELMMDLEEEFGIEISDDEAVSIKTVGDIVDYITKNT